MSLPRYGEYKDSGVEWLGAIPSHWLAIPIKALGRLKGGAGFPHDEQGIQGEELDFFKVNSLGAANASGILGRSENTISRGTAAQLGAFIFPPHTVVFAKVGAALLLGRVREIPRPACIDNNMMGLVVSADNEATFVRYAMELVRFDLIANPGAVPSLNEGQIGNFSLSRPPKDEQGAIAAFLDRETAKIDALIAEQEKLIALLAEKRQAIISHAVTRGLNSSVPLKESGVAWLGEVPSHWDVVPLKYLVVLRSGGTPSKDNLEYWDGDVPWASAKDLKVERLEDTADHITQKAIADGAASLIPPGAVLVVVRGMILARIFPVVETLAPMAINQDLKAVLPLDRLDVSFLTWLLRGSADESLLRLDEAGHGTKALRMDTWTSMQLPVPPLAEQRNIASFLSDGTSKLTELCAKVERAIEVLKERRSALVAAAVTGQIDVRERA